MKRVATFCVTVALLLVSQTVLTQNTSSMRSQPEFRPAIEPSVKVPATCDTEVLNADGAWTSTGRLVASKPYCSASGASSRNNDM